MSYNYRWFYAITVSAMIIVVAIFYDIQPLASQVLTLKKERHQWRDKRRDLQEEAQKKQTKKMPTASRLRSPLDSMSELIWQAERSGLSIKALNTMDANTLKLMDVTSLHVEGLGSFAQISVFATALSNDAYPITLIDFSFKEMTAHHLFFTADLFFSDYFFEKNAESETELLKHSPFCSDANVEVAIPKADDEKAQSAALSFIKMIGYLSQGEQQSAFVLLPNKVVALVKPGSLLGRERGLVTAVFEDRIHILLPNNERFVVKKS